MFAFCAYYVHTRIIKKEFESKLTKNIHSCTRRRAGMCCNVWTSTCTQMQTPTHCLQRLNDFTLTFTGMFYLFFYVAAAADQ